MGNIKKRISILNEMYRDKVDVLVEDAFENEEGTFKTYFKKRLNELTDHRSGRKKKPVGTS